MSDDIISTFSEHLAAPTLNWLLGAGISYGANIPLMYPLTRRIEVLCVNGSGKSNDIFQEMKADLSDDAHVEFILTHLADYIDIAKRRRERKANTKSHVFSIDELIQAHQDITGFIAETIRYGYVEGKPDGEQGSREKSIIKIGDHQKFINAVFRRSRANIGHRRAPVKLFGRGGSGKMSKVVQENFGEAIITAIVEFAKSDLRTVDQLKTDEFSHVGDANLKDSLAETFYGARWIYKLGLALLVRDSEQMAHVRTQVMDYGAVCEGLLSDVILHALQTNRMNGQKYRFADPTNSQRPINWQVQDKLAKLTKQSFFWHIEVAREENCIDPALFSSLHKMRNERNTVHVRARTHKAYLGTSRLLFDTVMETIRQTKAWRATNP